MKPNPPPCIRDDDGLALETIAGDRTTDNALLGLMAERIRRAAELLRLTRKDLHRIFSRHSIFEGETPPATRDAGPGFILVETHHHIQGKVGKGALKLVFPEELLGKGPQFREVAPGTVEVLPRPDRRSWDNPDQAETVVRQAMREFMTGESLSMSLKSLASGAPFSGSEGLLLCAIRHFDPATGRYLLQPALTPGCQPAPDDKTRIEGMMNDAAAMLTRAGRIAHDKIVHAAETNSTLTARLDLQLPTNVVEGHLRTLLQQHPHMVIGDDDMTARLRELAARPEYSPTACALARAAARMQMEHSVLLPGSREKLRGLLAELAGCEAPTPAQYRQIIELFFGTGEIQQNEDQLYHHREPILKSLSIALSARSLDDCGEPEVLAFYLRTLLDNQRLMLEAAMLGRLPRGQALPLDWFDRARLLSPEQERRLATLTPGPGITRDKVKEHFWEVVKVLCEAKGAMPRFTPDPWLQARREVLDRATRAITVAAELLPSADRILFFTLPFAYECVTPKLGVVTRKPLDVCGSELRPEAMALGGVMAMEIVLKKLQRKPDPLRGLTVAIEGLGNAGKHVATLMMRHGARIVGVSDSRGALRHPDGFTREELAIIIAHKNAGCRLDTLLASTAARGLSERTGPHPTFHPDPAELKRIAADLLVLAAIPASVHRANAPHVQARVLGELAGGAVTSDAKRVLNQRGIQVVPDNLASSGGLLVSLSEMLQNCAGQNWDRKLEEYNLYEQLSRSYDAVLQAAREYAVDACTASDLVALRRMHDQALYREQLEALSARLAARIAQIQPRDPVLVLSDDDEDGVASAAILFNLVARLNPGAESRLRFLNASFRSDRVLEWLRRAEANGAPVRHVFVLDRSFPVTPPGQARLAEVARQCPVVFVNNQPLPPALPVTASAPDPAAAGHAPQTPAELEILLICPQTLRATVPAREFTTAMILKEIAQQLIADQPTLLRIQWHAAVGSCLDVSPEPSGEWQWFFARFNPDRTRDAARALRMVTRAGGFDSAIQALLGVARPDQLETHEAWGQFIAEYRALAERVHVLVEKIVVANRRRPFTAHFFTHDEIASPTPLAGDDANELDFYHWISEHLTQRGDLANKPVIVGQIVRDARGRRWLGVRIRSPQGVDLMDAGLPETFHSGGLPNTAVARLPLEPGASAEQSFAALVDAIWRKTTSALHLGVSTPAG
ncbi:MAG: hypothetical protein JXQ71_15260 [Verrucomicrobia bacterium]|nr:hypothetical protein [Verrucomicrobiota bacterium]